MTGEDVTRLERAGFAAWRAAEELREVRERWPASDADRLGALLRELEEGARTVAGEVAMRLREVAEVAGHGWDRPATGGTAREVGGSGNG